MCRSHRSIRRVGLLGALAVAAVAACDPRVDRDNPYDPQNPRALCATLTVLVEGAPDVARRLHVELAHSPGQCFDGVDGVVEDGVGDHVDIPRLRPGVYRVRVEAAGYRAAEAQVELGNGDEHTLERLVLVDDADPVAPGFTVPARPVRARVVDIGLDHPEPGVRFAFTARVDGEQRPPEVIADDDGRPVALRLADADGAHDIEVRAIDRAERASPPTTARVELDRVSPGADARLSVVGAPVGEAAAETAEVDVRVVPDAVDATGLGVLTVRAAEGEVCAPTVPGCDCAMPECPDDDVPCRAALPTGLSVGGATRITLRDGANGQPGIGRYCVYGRLADDAGNLRDLPPVQVDRPRAQLTVLGARADGQAAPVSARVEVRRAGAVIDTLDGDEDGVVRAVDLTPGRHVFTARADGYAPIEVRADLVMGDAIDLGRVVLGDAIPPISPTLALDPPDVVTRGPTVEVVVGHDEPSVRVELALDGEPVGEVEPVPGADARFEAPLGAPDGPKRITAVAIDRAGNRSAAAALSVLLDTTPPTGGALRVAGGQSVVRGDNEVDVQVLDADVDAAGLWLASIPGEVCDEAICDGEALACDRPLVGSARLVLGPTEGPYCVCGRLCDAVGNAAPPLAPVPVTLGPFVDRPVPVIDRLVPSEKAARPDEDPWLCIVGRDIAVDTVADVGPFTSLPCEPTVAETPCARYDVAGVGWGTVCVVELPDPLRLASGQHPVWLRTPAPVQGGDGRSVEVPRLTLVPPRPLIDRVDPMGVAVGDLDPEGRIPVQVRIDGADLTLNTVLSLAGRSPIAVERWVDPAAPRRVSLVATFDVADVQPRWDANVVLAVTNPGGDRVEVPFGLTPPIYGCPPEGRCTIPVRRTLPAGADGYVQLTSTMPQDGRTWSLQVRGGAFWSLRRDGAPPVRVAVELGWGQLPLPGPLPGALVVAEVPAWHGGTIGLEPRDRIGRLPQAPRRTEAAPLDGPVGDVLYVDLDLDGESDVVASHPSLGRLSLVVGGRASVIDLDGAPSALARGDIDGDGHPEVIVADDAGGPLRVLYTGPGGAVVNVRSLPTPMAGLRAVAVADLDADRLPEIIVGAANAGGEGGLLAWSARADGRIVGPVELDRSGAVERIIVADHSQDGVDDLIFGGRAGLHALVATPGRMPRPGDARALPVQGARWFMLTETGSNGFEWLVVPGAPGACGYADPQQGCIQLLVGEPGSGWGAAPITVAPSPDGFVGLAVADIDADGIGELIGQMPFGDGLTLTVSEVAPFEDVERRTPAPFHTPFDDPVVGVDLGAPPFHAEADNWTLDLSVTAMTRSGRWAVITPSRPPPVEDNGEGNDPLNLGLGDDPAPVASRAWLDVDGDGWSDHVTLTADGIFARSPNPAVRPFRLREAGGPASLGLVVTRPAPFLVAAIGRALWVRLSPADWRSINVRRPIVQIVALEPHRVAVLTGDAGLPGGDDVVIHQIPLGAEVGRLSTRCGEDLGRLTRLRAVYGAPQSLVVERGDGDPLRVDVPLQGPVTCSVIASQSPVGPDVLGWLPADLDGDGAPERIELALLPPSDLHVRVYSGEEVEGARGPGGWRFGDERGEPIELRRVVEGARLRAVLHVADPNRDGAPDLVVGVELPQGEPDRRFWMRTLFGRAGGTLGLPVWSRYPTDSPDAVGHLAIGVADVTGEGLPDIIAARGDDVAATTLASTTIARLFYTESVSFAEGRGAVVFDLPGGWLDRLGVIVELGGRETHLDAVLVTPRGDRLELDSRGEWSTHWWRGRGVGDPAADALGRQPSGRWRLELTGDVAEAQVTLLPGFYWERPREGRDWDADGDGVPEWRDCDPAAAVWPAGCVAGP